MWIGRVAEVAGAPAGADAGARSSRSSRSSSLVVFAMAQAIAVYVAFVVAWRWAAARRARGRRGIEARGTARSAYCVPSDDDDEEEEEEEEDGDDDDDDDDDGGVRRRRRTRGAARSRSRTRRSAAPPPPSPPPVAIVLPVKGVKPDSEDNWRAQLSSSYAGDREYVFVVESADDPAAAAATRLAKEFGRDRAGRAGRVRVRVLEAGSSTRSSQKIHSMLKGARAVCGGGGDDDDDDAGAKYVLFLDDDVRTHANTIGSLVSSMETLGEDAFLVNGYPFDIPEESAASSAAFVDYLTMVYHLVLIVAFSQGAVAKNVWGGCMLLRASDVRQNTHGWVTRYEDGGYSDDLILASLCDEHARVIGCPFDALFPQRMGGGGGGRKSKKTFARWWNYLRRQLFVMDTYSNAHNRRVNHAMLLVLSYLSLAVTTGMACALTELASWGSARSEVDVRFPSLAAAVVVAFACAVRSARAMYAAMGDLAEALGDADANALVKKINWAKVAAAFACAYALVPIAAAITATRATVVWEGVAYEKRRGKVTRRG